MWGQRKRFADGKVSLQDMKKVKIKIGAILNVLGCLRYRDFKMCAPFSRNPIQFSVNQNLTSP